MLRISEIQGVPKNVLWGFRKSWVIFYKPAFELSTTTYIYLGHI